MGRKRGKIGQHLFLHGTCFLAVLIMSAGCATISTFEKKSQANKKLDLAEDLTQKKDYEGALRMYGDVLAHFPQDSLGDRALFHMGLIWAHPDNPNKNYENALRCFRQLLDDFPKCVFRDEVRGWIGAMNELIRREGKIKDLEGEVSGLKRRLNGSKEEMDALKSQLDGLKRERHVLKTRLRELKEIDIGIEEKKRESRP